MGPISDTAELLRGVDASARESYYRGSSSRYRFYIVVVVILLAVAVIGVIQGGLLGHVLALGGALGLALVAIWLTRS